MVNEIPEWIKGMPKFELHRHLGGSLSLNKILEFGEKYKINLPADSVEDLRKYICFKEKGEKRSLTNYLEGVTICESVLAKPLAFQEGVYDICREAHDKENIVGLELRFAPTNYENSNQKLYEVVEGVLDGLRIASRDFNMYTGLIVCGVRSDPLLVRKAAEIAVNYMDNGVVGFDIAGKEKGYRPKLYEEAIKPVLKNFLPVTIHAGEEDDVGSIAEAFIYLHAERIGHAISLRESPKLIKFMDNTRKTLEICMTSNVDTGAVRDISTHPVKQYYNLGLRIAISTDNPIISDTDLNKEYSLLVNEFGFKKEDILNISRGAIKSAFFDSSLTKKYLDNIDSYFKNLI
jgi:adenosine deaminase